MKKGQVSLFIIIGVVLVIAVALFIAMMSKSEPNIDTHNSIDDDKKLTAELKSSIQQCISGPTDEALFLIGIQGGRLYKDQLSSSKDDSFNGNGLLSLPYTVGNKDYFVSYGIFAAKNDSMPKPYSYSDVTKNNFAWDFTMVDFFQGNLPALCDDFGANTVGLVGEKNRCKTYSSTNSIEKYIRGFVYEKSSECLAKLNTSKKYRNLGVNISRPNINVVFTYDDVIIDADVPVVVKSDSSFKMKKIEVKRDVRLKQMYDLVTEIIRADSSDISFSVSDGGKLDSLNRCYNPITGAYNSKCYKKGFTVTRKYGLCLNCKYRNSSNIIIVEDQASKVFGMNYKFIFAVENRLPLINVTIEGIEVSSPIIIAQSSSNVFTVKLMDPDDTVKRDSDDIRVILGYNDDTCVVDTNCNSNPSSNLNCKVTIKGMENWKQDFEVKRVGGGQCNIGFSATDGVYHPPNGDKNTNTGYFEVVIK